MKVYKVTLMVIDFDRLGASEITELIENNRYPNHCMSPNVMGIESRDIGEWNDDHLLNTDKQKAEFERLFGKTT